jgi:hypothetical protein
MTTQKATVSVSSQQNERKRLYFVLQLSAPVVVRWLPRFYIQGDIMRTVFSVGSVANIQASANYVHRQQIPHATLGLQDHKLE